VGAAARRKRDRIKLSEAHYFKLKACLAQRALLLHQQQAQLADLNRVIDQTIKEAGLTPGVSYEMDEKTLSATVRT
jgi:hypothetical protein